MANQTELESMLIRLIGDGSSYQKMMTDAAKQSQDAASKIEQAGKQIESIANQMKGFAASAVGALTTLGLAASLKGAFDSFSDFERSQIRIKNAIEASGQAVGPTLAHYKALTDEIMKATTASKGEVTGLIEKAQNMGKTGQALDNIVKNSLAFAAATGHGAESGFHLAQALEMGNAHMLKHALGLRFAKNDSEVLRIATQRLSAGYKDLAEINDTASGRLEKLGRTLKGLTIEFGGLVARGLQPIIDKVEEVVHWFDQLDPRVKEMAKVITLLTLAAVSLGPVWTALGPIFSLVLGPLKLIMSLVPMVASVFTFLGSAFMGLIGLIGSFSISGIVASIGAAIASLWEFVLPLIPVFLALGAAIAVVGTILVGLGSLIGAFITKMGGLGAAWDAVKTAGGVAWDWIKTKAMAFWNWLRPVVQAGVSFLTSVWELVVIAATTAWDWITEIVEQAWTAIVAFLNASGIDFTDLRNKVRDAFIIAEFIVRNFGKVWQLVWTGAQLQFVVVSDIIIDFFVNKIPAVLTWFGANWKDIFDDVVNLSTTAVKNNLTNQTTFFTNFFNWLSENVPKAFNVFDVVLQNVSRNMQNMVKNAVAIIAALPDLVKGKTSLDKLGLFNLIPLEDRVNEQFGKLDLTKGMKALDEGFIRKAQELHVPERLIGPLEQNLRAQYEALGKDVAGSFAEFYAKKLKEFSAQDQTASKEAGVKLAQGVTNGAKQEMQKIQGILRFSAEAVAHIDDYVEKLRGINKIGGTSAPGNQAAPGAPAAQQAPQPQPPPNPVTINNDNRRDKYLKAIQDAVIALANKQGVQIAAANLGGN